MSVPRLALALVSLLLAGGLLAGFILGQPQDVALAQSPQQSYDLSWWTVDGGGGTSTAEGIYALDGTAGQPDPGPRLSGGDYTLQGGFWGGRVSGVTMFEIYLPLVVNGY